MDATQDLPPTVGKISLTTPGSPEHGWSGCLVKSKNTDHEIRPVPIVAGRRRLKNGVRLIEYVGLVAAVAAPSSVNRCTRDRNFQRKAPTKPTPKESDEFRLELTAIPNSERAQLSWTHDKLSFA